MRIFKEDIMHHHIAAKQVDTDLSKALFPESEELQPVFQDEHGAIYAYDKAKDRIRQIGSSKSSLDMDQMREFARGLGRKTKK